MLYVTALTKQDVVKILFTNCIAPYRYSLDGAKEDAYCIIRDYKMAPSEEPETRMVDYKQIFKVVYVESQEDDISKWTDYGVFDTYKDAVQKLFELLGVNYKLTDGSLQDPTKYESEEANVTDTFDTDCNELESESETVWYPIAKESDIADIVTSYLRKLRHDVENDGTNFDTTNEDFIIGVSTEKSICLGAIDSLITEVQGNKPVTINSNNDEPSYWKLVDFDDEYNVYEHSLCHGLISVTEYRVGDYLYCPKCGKKVNDISDI